MEQTFIEHRLPQNVTNLALKRDLPYEYQGSWPSCVAASLKMALRYKNVSAPSHREIYKQMRRECCGGGWGGLAISHAASYARRLGCETWYGRGTIETLKYYTDLDIPVVVGCIAFGGGGHAIVVTKVTRKYVYYKNPRSGDNREHEHPIDDFVRRWRNDGSEYAAIGGLKR
jgi:ABC-type bacteriocin/lantibiotic exporter with double-glycine peptidase domain